MNLAKKSIFDFIKRWVVTLFLGGIATSTLAGAPPSYYFPDPEMYTNGTVRALLLHEGKLYIGGDFSKVTGSNGTFSRVDLAAYDVATGTVLPFEANTNRGTVRAITVGDGKLFVGGSFSKINGTIRYRVAAVDPNTGEVDTTFRNGKDRFTGEVWALAFTDNTVFVGGSFDTIDGIARHYLAAVDDDSGSVLPGFDPSPCDPMDDSGRTDLGVLALQIHPNNPQILFVAGNFMTINGMFDRPFLAAVTTKGEPGPEFEDRMNSPVLDLDATDDFLCAAAGGFANRVYAFGISSDPYVRYWKGEKAEGDAQAVAMASEGYVYFGFHEGLFDSTDCYRMAVLDANDGSVVDNYPPTNSFFGVFALAIDDNVLAVGGDFTEMNRTSQRYLAVFTDLPFMRKEPLPLVVPEPVAPYNRKKGVAVDAEFRWNAVPRASTYQVQVASDSGFSLLIADTAGIADYTLYVTGMEHSAAFWWRVRAHNIVLESNWSEVRYFTTVPGETDVPVISCPLYGAVDQPVTLHLAWYPSSPTLSYSVQVSSDSDFMATVTAASGITDTSLYVGPLANSTGYFWRVNAETIGGVTEWSTAWFTTIIGKPGIPQGITPFNDSRRVSLQPELSWNTSPDASRYSLQIATDSFFNEFAVDTVGISDTFFVSSPLEEDTRYFWRVQSVNIGGKAWSSPMCFTTLFSCPHPPKSLFPEQGFTAETGTVNFSWEPSTPHVTRYCIAIAQDSSMINNYIDSMVVDTQFTGSGLRNYGDFWWQVRACNETGWSAYSEKKQFKTRFPFEWTKRFSLDRFSFFPSGAVRYSIAEPCDVTMELFNLHGVPVWKTVREQGTAGPYVEYLPSAGLASGKYFLSFKAGKFVKKSYAVLVR